MKNERLDIYPSPVLRRAIDMWRANRRDPMPSRADAAKELIELGLKADTKAAKKRQAKVDEAEP
jgi:hypothetical protein